MKGACCGLERREKEERRMKVEKRKSAIWRNANSESLGGQRREERVKQAVFNEGNNPPRDSPSIAVFVRCKTRGCATMPIHDWRGPMS
jgi:hypothetical protein